ncbi:hypothetical protein ACSBR2_011791 [Camellia fascicularis]
MPFIGLEMSACCAILLEFNHSLILIRSTAVKYWENLIDCMKYSGVGKTCSTVELQFDLLKLNSQDQDVPFVLECIALMTTIFSVVATGSSKQNTRAIFHQYLNLKSHTCWLANFFAEPLGSLAHQLACCWQVCDCYTNRDGFCVFYQKFDIRFVFMELSAIEAPFQSTKWADFYSTHWYDEFCLLRTLMLIFLNSHGRKCVRANYCVRMVSFSMGKKGQNCQWLCGFLDYTLS